RIERTRGGEGLGGASRTQRTRSQGGSLARGGHRAAHAGRTPEHLDGAVIGAGETELLRRCHVCTDRQCVHAVHGRGARSGNSHADDADQTCGTQQTYFADLIHGYNPSLVSHPPMTSMDPLSWVVIGHFVI